MIMDLNPHVSTDWTIARRGIAFIDSPDFESHADELAKEAAELLGNLEDKRSTPSRDMYLYSHGLGDLPVLTRDQEQACFRGMNFLKYQVGQLQQLEKQSASPARCREILRLLEDIRLIRDHLIYSNLRLVISLVKKYVTPQLSFDELYSEGVVTLMQAVEKFDYRRGFRFSTYAYRSISRAMYHAINNQQQENTLFVDDAEQWVETAAEPDGTSARSDQLWRNMREHLTQLIQRLDRREQLIVRARYALNPQGKIKTFQTLANKLGISKERVRQLEQRAVAKLTAMASEVELAGSLAG